MGKEQREKPVPLLWRWLVAREQRPSWPHVTAVGGPNSQARAVRLLAIPLLAPVRNG